MIENKALKTLEYDKILKMLSSFAQSSSAKEKLAEIRPATSLDEAFGLLSETREADRVLFEYATNPSFSVDNLHFALNTVEKMAVLPISEILKVGRCLATSRRLDSSISKCIDVPILKGMLCNLHVNQRLEDRIFESFISDTEVADNASQNLKIIRQKIRRQNANIKSRLIGYTRMAKTSKVLQDNIVTIRENRYVIPVKSECKGQIPGLIHDQSASGSTLYVEPIEIVELNNELKVLLVEEQNEIERILRDFSDQIAVIATFLRMTYDTIVDMDIIFSKAQLAKVQKAICPELNTRGEFAVKNGRHPLIDPETVVPISIRIEKSTQMLLITGPNTGGKTVTLKLVGLFTAMALSGLFLPCHEANIAMFDSIYCDIGDEQSIEQCLSTFSAHIKNIIDITHKMNTNSLLLLDELGAGTDPAEGASLAVSISESILQCGAKAVVTSHFNDLKEFALKTNFVDTASMDFDETTFSPTFKLVMGSVGTSNALKIATRLGLDKKIVERAESYITNEKKDFDNVIMSAEETRRFAEKIVEEAQSDRILAKEYLLEAEQERNLVKQKKEKLDDIIRKETKKLIAESVEEATEIIDELKAILKKNDVSDADVFTAQKLRKKLENMSAKYQEDCIVPVTPCNEKAKVGDKVWVVSLAKNGVLVSINERKKESEIKLGKILMKIKNNDYYKIK